MSDASDAHPPSRRGRPIKLTAEVEAKILRLLSSGATLEAAAELAGISARTLQRWRRRGEKKRRGTLARLNRAIERSLAQAEVHAVLEIRKAGAKNWQAAAWYLERRWPERWGRTSRERAVESKDRPSPEQLAAQIREFLKQTGGNDP